MALIARLSRTIPLLIALAIIAAIIYLVVTYLHSPSRAKEVLIKVFTWLNGIIIAFFGVATLYAVFEHNDAVFDLMITFMLVGVIGMAITLICRAIFFKHHPGYRDKPEKAKVQRNWQDIAMRILNLLLRRRS